MTKACKRGKAGQKEIQYIKDNPTKSTEALAKDLNRTVNFVKKWRGDISEKIDVGDRDSHVHKLRASSFWKETKKGFIDLEEQQYFEDEWAGYMEQFHNAGISKTDVAMVKDLIWLEIFCNRMLSDRAKCSKKRVSIEDDLYKELKLGDNADRGMLAILKEQIATLRTNEESYDTNFEKLSKEKSGKLAALQKIDMDRLKQDADADKNIFALIKKLSTKKMRVQEGELNAKVNEGKRRIREIWEAPYRYSDDIIDYPMLTPELMKSLDESETPEALMHSAAMKDRGGEDHAEGDNVEKDSVEQDIEGGKYRGARLAHLKRMAQREKGLPDVEV